MEKNFIIIAIILAAVIILSGCEYSAFCGNGLCEIGEQQTCPGDCAGCIGEGQSVPVTANQLECCEGLSLIQPKESGLVGTSGICTAYCGNGVCNTATESSYNCPEDCQGCVDSDGFNYFIKGNISTENRVTVDWCRSDLVFENYCENGHAVVGSYLCPNGCEDGACIRGNQTLVCKDSDGGKDYYVKGSTYGESQRGNGPEVIFWDDYCVGNSLIEFSCLSLTFPTDSRPIEVWSDNYECPNGCYDGACIHANQTTEICKDSDGGIDPFSKGTVIGLNQNNQRGNLTDHCWGMDGQTLVEYYCDEGYMQYDAFVECEYGCSDGACLSQEPECFDSDSVDNIYIKGYATIDAGTTKLYDECGMDQGYHDENVLLQSYCVGSVLRKDSEYTCPNGCEDGACIPANATCDTDGGTNYYEKGTATGHYGVVEGISTMTDYCNQVNQGQLIEYQCGENGGVTFDTFDCPNGCKDGACIPTVCTDLGESYWCASYAEWNQECNGRGDATKDVCIDHAGELRYCVSCMPQEVQNESSDYVGENFFLLSKNTYSADFGSLAGADKICLAEVNNFAWLNKPDFDFQQSDVHAFLCDTEKCYNLKENEAYYFGTLDDATVGGASLTTNDIGAGPNNNKRWSDADAFGQSAWIFSGRNYVSNTEWKISGTGSMRHTCNDWTYSGPDEGCIYGFTWETGRMRWETWGDYCDHESHIICVVD